MNLPWRWRNIGIFLTIAIVGLVFSQACYLLLETSQTAPAVMNERSLIKLSDADKLLIGIRTDLSKWLLGITLVLLPGLIIEKTKDHRIVYQRKVLPHCAGGMLIVSIYGYYLAQMSTIYVLSIGPQYHLYGEFFDFPIMLQFWSLLLGLVLLLFHWTRGNVRAAAPALVAASVFYMSPTASAQGATPDIAVCIAQWSKDRTLALNTKQITLARKVAAGVAGRAGVHVDDGCAFARTQLDHLRWLAFKDGGRNPEVKFLAILATVNEDLTGAGIGSGSTLEGLLKIADIWRHPSGLLVIQSPRTAHVLLSGADVAVTNVDIRLAPGFYAVQVVRGGELLLSDPHVSISEGGRTELVVP